MANGHGETAIAARIASELAAVTGVRLELLPLVGTGAGAAPLEVVGPRRAMPSGGLVAMGNLRAFARDVGAGFAALFGRQLRFLWAARGRFDAVVAVGDAYALGLALLTRTPLVFVGTAKSVYVAPYGPFERCLLRRAARIFVRDEPTAVRLRREGVAAEAPGNVIVDLVRPGPPAPPGKWLGLLPGSREEAYADGVRLARVARALNHSSAVAGALFSIAPTLEAVRFARLLSADGWQVEGSGGEGAFEARYGEAHLVAWHGELGSILESSLAVLGQAGTANEQAAARGVPVIALEVARRRGGWYRMRQRRLLGEALFLAPAEPAAAAAAISGLLADEPRLRRMSEAGVERMGPPGGAAKIARSIADLAAHGPRR